MEGKKYHNIELLRIVFALIIVYFHILHSNILGYIGENELYYLLGDLCEKSTLIVECFFIMSGYFLFQSYIKHPEMSFLQFVLKKIFRLAPVLLFSLLLGIIFFSQRVTPAVFNALFLQCIGVSVEYKGINWYISPLFWTLIFYFALLKNFNYQKVNVVIAVIVYCSYVVLVENGFDRETIFGFLNLGLLRGLGGIGLGYLIGLGVFEFKRIKIKKGENYARVMKYIVFSFTEILAAGYLLQYFLLGGNYNNSFVVVIVFSVLMVCFITESGFLARLFDKKAFSLLGRYAYSIYVMQQTSFYILQKTLWKMALVNNVGLCITVSLFFCFIMGVLTYHLVEQPCAKLYTQLEFRKIN